MPAQTFKQLTQQSRVLQGWIEREMTVVWGLTPAGPDREVSVHPTP